MRRLRLTDILKSTKIDKIDKIDKNELEYYYTKHDILENISTIPTISNSVCSKRITLTENKISENKILDNFIKNIIETYDYDEVVFRDLENVKKSEIDNFFNRIYDTMKHIYGFNNDVNIIIGPMHQKLFYYYEEYLNNNIFVNNYVYDKIIIYLFNEYHHYKYFHNDDKYAIVDIGDIKNQCKLIKVKFLKQERQKKLKNIIR